MLTVSGCVRKGKEQDKVYQETGMFEWSEEAVCEPEEALYLAKELGITKWYQETNGMTEVEATGKFVKALHNRKIEVYALLGAVEWGYEEDGATLLAHLEKIVQYNVQSSEKEKFDGVMLDIEPYISDSWMPQLLGSHTGQRLLHLNGDDLPGDVGLPLLQRLAYAQNNLQAAFQRRAHPLGHRLIGLAKVLPALAVSDDDILHPQLLQHRR